jgi:hypothetical protein
MKTIYKIGYLLNSVVLLLLVRGVSAIEPIPYLDETHPLRAEGARQVVDIVEDFIFWIGIILGGIAILSIFWAGFLFMTSGDNQSQLTRAKKWLIWGLVGIVVSIFATAIVPLVYSFLEGGLL